MAGVCLALGAGVLTQVDAQVRTPVGAAGVGTGPHPVAEIAGLGSNGSGFDELTKQLRARGTTVLDFNATKPGIQPLTYMPSSGSEHIPQLAAQVVQPAIRAALARAGLPADQEIDVVAHSMGGLLARSLIELPGNGIDAGWAKQVDDLVMIATPNHGSSVVALETDFGLFKGLGQDMKPGSALLRRLGTTEPAGEVYTTIGGDPWELRWIRYGSHGFDNTVPSESPFMTGAAHDTFSAFHGQLVHSEPVIRLVLATLAAHAR